jgi:hypothetical protein
VRARAGLAVAAVLAVLLVAGLVFAGLTAGAAGSPEDGWSPPVAGAGPSTVELSADAAAHPAGAAVRAQLQRHFDAINAKDYVQWRGTVVPERVQTLPEPRWQAAYGSTRDGAIRVYRIDDAPGGTLLVRLRFVSTQSVEDAPPELQEPRICWRSTLPMVGHPLLIERTGGGSSAAEGC